MELHLFSIFKKCNTYDHDYKYMYITHFRVYQQEKKFKQKQNKTQN